MIVDSNYNNGCKKEGQAEGHKLWNIFYMLYIWNKTHAIFSHPIYLEQDTCLQLAANIKSTSCAWEGEGGPRLMQAGLSPSKLTEPAL